MRSVWTILLLIYIPSTLVGYSLRSNSGKADSLSLGDQCSIFSCGVRHHSGEVVRHAGGLRGVSGTSSTKIPTGNPHHKATVRGGNRKRGLHLGFSGTVGGNPLTPMSNPSPSHSTLCHQINLPKEAGVMQL